MTQSIVPRGSRSDRSGLNRPRRIGLACERLAAWSLKAPMSGVESRPRHWIDAETGASGLVRIRNSLCHFKSVLMQTATATSGANAVVPKRFTPLVQQFLDYLRLEKHFSDYTVKSYGADLIQYGQFLSGEIGQHNADPPLNVVIPDSPASLDEKQTKAEPLQIREFLAYLYGQHYTKSTTARKLATLRSFYKFLIKRNLTTNNPLTTIRTPKQEKRLPKCLDLEQVQKLLDAPGDGDLLSARDKAMLEVLYSSGIRVSELVELEMGDIDLQEGVLRVKGKGRKDRLTPIGSQAIKAIQRYFEMRNVDAKSQGQHSGRVFLNKHGAPLS